MVEFPESQLPRDPAYWEDLAQRINRDAADPLASYASFDSWHAVLAGKANWLVGFSVAAMLVLWLAAPTIEAPEISSFMRRLVVPEEMAGALLSGPVPPSVDALVTQFAPISERGYEQ